MLPNDIKKHRIVTVTPIKTTRTFSIDKKINENLDSFQTFDGQPYNYTTLQQQYQVMLLNYKEICDSWYTGC